MANNQLEDLEKLRKVWSQLNPVQRKWLRIQGEAVYYFVLITNFIYRIDLWFFPPAAFFSSYNIAIQNYPDHPIKMIAVLSTAFMCAAFTLLVIRPKRKPHWVRS